MVRRRLKLYPYHTLLVIPFIVLFLYAQNATQLTPPMTYRTIFYGLVLTIALYGIFYLILRSRLRAGIFVTILLFMLFQYGVIYDTLEMLYFQGKWPFKNIHRYLVSFYFLLMISVLIYMKRTKQDFFRMNYFLNFLVFLLILFNLFKVNAASSFGHSQPVSHNELTAEFKNKTKPDIFYIILDGYASSGILKSHYHFDNSEFESLLRSNAFSISESAFANYYYTAQSLAATMNLNYLDNERPVSE